MYRKKIILLSCLLMSLLFGSAQDWDIDAVKNINPRNPNSGFWHTTSGSAYFIPALVPMSVLVTGIIKHDPELKRKSYEIFGAVVIDLVITETVKLSVNRLRPAEKYPNDIFPYRVIHGKSFPSGHSSMAFATAASLSLQCRKWYVTIPSYLWAASVGYSRIYLGVHYPSDVLAGAVVGTGSAYLSHWLNKKLFRSGKKKSPG